MVWKGVMGVVVSAILGMSSVFYGSLRWQWEIRRLQVAMAGAHIPLAKKSYDFAALKELPAQVERYFHRVLKANPPMVTAVRIHYRSMFNVRESGKGWKPFSSLRHVAMFPGFL